MYDHNEPNEQPENPSTGSFMRDVYIQTGSFMRDVYIQYLEVYSDRLCDASLVQPGIKLNSPYAVIRKYARALALSDVVRGELKTYSGFEGAIKLAFRECNDQQIYTVLYAIAPHK